STRFESRRNQGDVGSGFDEVGEALVVVATISKSRRIAARGDCELRFKGWITFAENDQTHVIGKHSVEQRCENAETFFSDNARYYSEHGAARRRRQPQAGQQRVTTNRFVPKLFRVKVRGKERIRIRIPARIICPVQDSA